VQKESLPPELLVTAVDKRGEVMAMRHRNYNLRGLQFHPESIMTPQGKQLLENFFRHCAKPEQVAPN